KDSMAMNLKSEVYRITCTLQGKVINMHMSYLCAILEIPNEAGRPIDLMGDFDEVTTLKNLTRDDNYYPNYTANHLNVHSRLLHHYITYNILPRIGHREIIHTLDIFLINSILMGKAINLGYILMTQMREAGSKKTGCLPYGMVLTRIFDHFEISLHDKSVKEK
ncbi:hypothetical protein PanWU01x14_332180, partial [Parasponia andersonii]